MTSSTKYSIPHRRFFQNLTEINRLYWCGKVQGQITRHVLKNYHGDALITSVDGVFVGEKELHRKCAEFDFHVTKHENRMNAIYVVSLSASFETYLKDMASAYVVTEARYRNIDYTPNKIGEQVVAPVLKSSSLVEPLKYLAILLNVDIAEELPSVIECYQIRCAMAHNFGNLGDESAAKLKHQMFGYDDPIYISWDILRGYMAAFSQIVNKFEKISSIIDFG